MSCVVQIGVTHGGVFSHDVHAANLVRIGVIGQGLVHDLYHGVTRLLVKRRVPKLFKPIVSLWIGNALVVGEHHGNEAGIAGPLHIVLTTQWMQTRTRLANLTGDRDQGNEAARVVSAVHVLADAHAPQNHRAFAGGKFTRHLAQRFCGHATNGRHGFGAVALDIEL